MWDTIAEAAYWWVKPWNRQNPYHFHCEHHGAIPRITRSMLATLITGLVAAGLGLARAPLTVLAVISILFAAFGLIASSYALMRPLWCNTPGCTCDWPTVSYRPPWASACRGCRRHR